MEKSAQLYSHFQNETPTNILPRPTPPPSYSPPQHNFSIDQKIAENCRRTKRLAIVEMVISCILLLFGIVSIILATNDWWFWTSSCVMGTSIWAPVLGIIAAGLGLGALKYDDHSRSCLLISHFVMCIISALASGILVIFASFCIATTSDWLYLHNNNFGYDPRRTPGVMEALMAFEVFILIGALINMIANIVSSAFMCQYWCGRKNGTGTIIYIPSQLASGNGTMQAISLPPGAQVIFLPANNQDSHVPVQMHLAA